MQAERQSSPSVLQTARSDPVGAGIVVCVVALFVLLVVQFAPIPPETSWIRWPELLSFPRRLPRPLEAPPAAWRTSAAPADVMTVPSYPVAYWGRPDASYGIRPTATAVPPVALVIHHTDDTPIVRLVRYGHRADPTRGGGAYGYHFYIDAQGRILQGAPLSARTNHIKPRGHPARTGTAIHLDGSNAIGVALVGACKSPPLSPFTYRCAAETITQAQRDAAMAMVDALRKRFKIACAAVWGHGELQTDRKAFEGGAIAAAARGRC